MYALICTNNDAHLTKTDITKYIKSKVVNYKCSCDKAITMHCRYAATE